jgi:hypothetical protein
METHGCRQCSMYSTSQIYRQRLCFSLRAFRNFVRKERGYRFYGHACRTAHGSWQRRGCVLRLRERFGYLDRSVMVRRVDVARLGAVSCRRRKNSPGGDFAQIANTVVSRASDRQDWKAACEEPPYTGKHRHTAHVWYSDRFLLYCAILTPAQQRSRNVFFFHECTEFELFISTKFSTPRTMSHISPIHSAKFVYFPQLKIPRSFYQNLPRVFSACICNYGIKVTVFWNTKV